MLKDFLRNLRLRASAHGFSCDACKAEIFDYPHKRLCDSCMAALNRNNKHVCPKCGRRGAAEGVCLNCKHIVPDFTFGASPFVYRGETAALVNRIKNGERYLAYFFGQEMANCLLSRFPQLQTERLLLVPVPLTKEREKERGYNQSQQLCEAIVRCLQQKGVDVELDGEVLQKQRETSLQKHLGVVGRMENVAGVYHVHKRTKCKNCTLVLVDDIMTTGATGSECARVLLQAGAKEVYFLVAAALPEIK